MAVKTQQAAEATKSQDTPAEGLVVIEIGKRQRRKRIKRLRQGRGRLFDRIAETIDHLKEDGSIAASCQPVIVVVREKRRRRKYGPFGRL